MDHDEYNRIKKVAKRKVAQAKAEKYKAMYDRLETKEGEKEVYRLAKERARKRNDIERVKCVKNESGDVLVDDEEIRKRWGRYFSELMNERNAEVVTDTGCAVGGEEKLEVQEVMYEEVEKALKKMKNGKAVGADKIPIEVWKVF